MRVAVTLAAVVIPMGALIACGNVYADPINGSPFSFGVGTSSSSGIAPVRVPPTECPLSIKENGPCDEPNAVCEFGTSSDPDCNPTFTCIDDPRSGRYWTETKGPRCAGKCPAAGQIVDGAPCTLQNRPDSGVADENLELQCPGPNTLCACTTGSGGANVHERRWVCVPAGEGCPLERPNVGRPCLGDRTCDYGSCAFKRGTGMICEQGVWQVEATPCP